MLRRLGRLGQLGRLGRRTLSAGTDGYTRPELLVEPDELQAALADDTSDTVCIDCSALEAYRRAHIPGAVRLPADIYLKEPATKSPGYLGRLLGGAAVEGLCASLGVGATTRVVAYDDTNGLAAARLWWVLQYYGLPSCSILNGGWNRWCTERRDIDFHATRPRAQPHSGAPFAATAGSGAVAMAAVEDEEGGLAFDGSVQWLDARSGGEVAGTDLRGNPRGGRLPGAAHVEWTSLVTGDDRRVFKSAAQIREIVEQAGIDLSPGAPRIATYCQGGIRAAHVAFALRLVGAEDVANFDGSFGQYSRLPEAEAPLWL